MTDTRDRQTLSLCLTLASGLSLLGLGCILGWTLRKLAVADLHDDATASVVILIVGLGLALLLMFSQYLGRKAQTRSRRFAAANQSLEFDLQDERALRATNECIMQFSRDLLCSIDGNGIFVAASAAAFEITGFQPEELLGRHYLSLVHTDDREATTAEAARVMAGAPTADFRNHLVHKSGQRIPLSWSAKWSGENQAMFCVGRDISTSMQAESLAKERRAFFSLTPEMFCIIDIQGYFHEVNPAFSQTLEFSRDELVGVPYLPLIHPDDQPLIEEAVRAMSRGEKIRDLEVRAFDRQSQAHWLQLNAALGEDGLIYVAARDITQLRATQQVLKHNKALLKIAGKAASIGGWMVDVATGEVSWSETLRDIYELPPGLVPNIEESLDYYVGASQERAKQLVNLCMQEGTPFDEELQLCTARGNLRWIRAIGYAVRDAGGRIFRIQGALQDISQARANTEEIERLASRLSTILDSITDAFVTLDKHMQFTSVNARAETLMQCSASEILGKPLWEVLPRSRDSRFHKEYQHAMATGETVFFEAYSESLASWVEVSAYPSEEGLAIYFRSIQERKQAEAELHKTMVELERSNRELEDFAFVASHDLQEPLRKIQAFSDRLISKSDHLTDKEKDYLARMQSAAKRMQALILDLLAYSRVNTRGNDFVRCDLNRIIDDILQDMEPTLKAAQAEIDLGPLPVISGDETQIRQVFQNLISNAVKFHAEDQPPRLHIHHEATASDGLPVAVWDEGIGFDLRYQERIFQPFQRLHHRTEYPGTGIGLAIVKKILDRHGATIMVESAPGKGASFRIIFPFAHQEHHAA